MELLQGRVLAGGGFCGKRPEAALCWADTLSQAEPTSDTGGTSVITYLGKGKKPIRQL